MRVKKTAVAMLALSAAIGVPAAGAAKPKHPSTAPAAKPAVKPLETYVFRGVVAVAPGAGATQLQLQINSGNKAAMLKMGALAGNGNIQAIPVGPTTSMVSWGADNKPTINPNLTATIQVADPVAVTILGTKTATLAQLFGSTANRVDDYLLSTKPHGRLFLFNGKAVAVDTVAHTITVNVLHTNWRAGYAMKTAGAASTLTFTYDPAKTTFVHWNQGKQQLFTPDKIVAGDSVTIKIIPNNYESHLSSLLTIAPWRVNDHEPMALVMKSIAANNTHKF